MISLSHLFLFLNYAFIVCFMFGIGLRVGPPGEFYQGVTRGTIFRVLLANVVLVPLVALLIRYLIPMRPEWATGFLLVAITPGGLLGIHFCHLARGQISYAVQLAFLLSLAAVSMVPLIAAIFLPAHVSSRFLDIRIVVEICIFALLPLIFGQVLGRRLSSRKVKRIASVLRILNPLLFVSQEIVGLKVKQFSMDSVGHEMLFAFVLLIVACWLIGWLLAGPGPGRRRVLAIDTSMRNAAICWLLVHHSFADFHAALAILAFNGVAVPMNFGFALMTRFFGRKPGTSSEAFA